MADAQRAAAFTQVSVI